MSLRFPAGLRARVRRFAAERGLEEATAVRTLCAERLQEIDLTSDLLVAERWQLQEARQAWDEWERGQLETLELDGLKPLFAEARRRK